MPVKVVGKDVVEKATGKVVAHGKTKSSAKKAAKVRNWAHAAKKYPGSAAAKSFHQAFGD